jgi:hypothetical protein
MEKSPGVGRAVFSSVSIVKALSRAERVFLRFDRLKGL